MLVWPRVDLLPHGCIIVFALVQSVVGDGRSRRVLLVTAQGAVGSNGADSYAVLELPVDCGDSVALSSAWTVAIACLSQQVVTYTSCQSTVAAYSC